ncbi:MAG: hypothetical protein ACOYCB_04285 [Fastidiosipilaceae bacterium]|jgi:Leucine-rich repeat (LRR) protein
MKKKPIVVTTLLMAVIYCLTLTTPIFATTDPNPVSEITDTDEITQEERELSPLNNWIEGTDPTAPTDSIESIEQDNKLFFESMDAVDSNATVSTSEVVSTQTMLEELLPQDATVKKSTGESEASVEDRAAHEPLATTAQTDSGIPIDETHFPDLNFREYLKNKYDSNADAVLSEREIADVLIINTEIESNDSFLLNIQDWQGIEYLKNLEHLALNNDCVITNLDVSQNKALEDLYLGQSLTLKITSLDVSKNNNLINFFCSGYFFNKVNFGANPTIKRLGIESVGKTKFDLSKFKNLDSFACIDAEYKYLSLRDNPNLENLVIYYDNELSQKIETLDISQNINLKYLVCLSCHLPSLDISNNPNLEVLYCDDNQLSTLDLSNNLNLKELVCSNNQLTTLDISNNSNLEMLYCENNVLTSLDLSNHSNLQSLTCHNNQLTSLDISKTAIQNWAYVEPNQLRVQPNRNGNFDLSTLPGNFDVTKVSNWEGGTLSGHILTPDPTADAVTYTYDIGKGLSANFSLVIRQDPVTNVTARPLAANTVDLAWDESPGVDGYLIFRKIDRGQLEYVYMVDEPYYVDRNAKNDTWNYYFIFSYIQRQDGSWLISPASQYAYAKPLSDDKIPQVQNLKATPLGLHTVHLKWTPVKDVDGYAIFRKTATGKLEYVYVTPNSSYTDTNAISDEYNFYFVFAYRRAKSGQLVLGAVSQYAYAKPSLPDVTRLRTNLGDRGVTVRWNRVTEADGYVIYRKVDGEKNLTYMYTVGKDRQHWTDLNPARGSVNFYFVTPYVKINGKMIINPVKPYTYAVVPE